MKKLLVSLFVLSLFAITTVSAQRSTRAISKNPAYAVKKGDIYHAKGVRVSRADQKALLKVGKQLEEYNNNYGSISTTRVRLLKAKINGKPTSREWWAIKNKDKWAFGGDIKATAKMKEQIDGIMAKYTKRGAISTGKVGSAKFSRGN